MFELVMRVYYQVVIPPGQEYTRLLVGRLAPSLEKSVVDITLVYHTQTEGEAQLIAQFVTGILVFIGIPQSEIHIRLTQATNSL